MAWQIDEEAARMAGGVAYQSSGYVFTMDDGRALKPQYVTRLFEKVRVEVGLPTMTFHGQRHQSASLLLQPAPTSGHTVHAHDGLAAVEASAVTDGTGV
ncbi:MAG: hypothetical protein QM747_17130 [Nocardioides sp.]